jgi:hypothetical protein
MITKAGEEAWKVFQRLLPGPSGRGAVALPASLEHRLAVPGYSLTEEHLRRLGRWLRNQGKEGAYRFRVEIARGEEPEDVRFGVDDLETVIGDYQKTCGDMVLTGEDFSWAVFLGHEGFIHIAGPLELLREFQEGSGRTDQP